MKVEIDRSDLKALLIAAHFGISKADGVKPQVAITALAEAYERARSVVIDSDPNVISKEDAKALESFADDCAKYGSD